MSELIHSFGRVLQSIQPLVLVLALVSGLSLAAAVLSLVAMSRLKSAACTAERRWREERSVTVAANEDLRQMLNDLAQSVQQLKADSAAVAAAPKPGFNLTKRSQALKMHRHGESTRDIARALDVPRQEVDLLLKVHRIVINNV